MKVEPPTSDSVEITPADTSAASAIDRQESLKAGIVGAIAAGLALMLMTLIEQGLKAVRSRFPYESISLPVAPASPLSLVISGAIVLFSGFLFAVTYRYVIRHDRNPQLKSGAVLAFGLVRGLAQVEVLLKTQPPLWELGRVVLESVILVAIVARLLDWAIEQQWIARMR